jgi:murein DD-endopeptidase MepM/ murein hydrolase activator NlpD
LKKIDPSASRKPNLSAICNAAAISGAAPIENAASAHSKWNFIQTAIAAPLSWRHKHVALAGVIVSLLIAAGATIPNWASAISESNTPRTTLDIPLPALSPEDAALSAAIDAANSDPLAEDGTWQVVKVRSGQTLGDIFDKQGLSATDLQRLLVDRNNASSLRNIHPGDEFAFQRDGDGVLKAMRFDRDEHTRVIAQFSGDAIEQKLVDREIEHRTHVAHGVIDSSLFGAGAEAGMSDMMVLKLATAFGYDIDFAQDLRQGDNFTCLYDDVYREGAFLRDGDIIACTFMNRGKRFTAFRFTNNAGETMYYTQDGRPLKKSFLKTPVDFTRITSGFSVARMHPILGLMRAHQGVDYGAPQGTPIRAAGDGKIAFRGWQPGYGNVVIIQHNAHNSTLYGHMSRFGGEQVGQRVTQGSTIGFVGMTGLATGPHLHYEFRIDGVHRNPLTVTTLPPEPLPGVELARFRGQAQPMLAKLKTLEATQLASIK